MPDTRKLKETKKEINRDGKPRYPRPLGLTLLCREYQNHQKPEIRERILNKTIEEYILNGLTLNGKPRTLEQMAILLDTGTKELMIRMNRGIERMSRLIMGEEGKAFARAQLMQAFFSVQQGTSMARAQAHMLYEAQKGEYVPFLTSAANDAIKNWMGASKPLTELLRLLLEPAPNGQTIINNNMTQANAGSLLTASEAVNLIKSEGMKSLIEDTDYELIDNKLQALPEVGAQYQDLSKIGIRQPNKAMDGQINDARANKRRARIEDQNRLLGGEIIEGE